MESLSLNKKKIDGITVLVFIYGLILPLEDFLFQDIIGSPSRIVAVLLFIAYIFKKGIPSTRFVSKYSIYYCIIILISLSWSTFPDYQGVFRIFVLLFSSVIFAILQKDDNTVIFTFLVGFTISGCYLGFSTLVEFFSAGVVERATIEDMNNNTLANAIAISSLFLIFILINKRGKNVLYPIFIMLLLINLGGLIATGSRGGMLAFVICLTFYLQSFIRKYVLIGISLFFLLLPFVPNFDKVDKLFDLVVQRSEKTEEDHGGNRIPIWKAGIGMFQEHPLTGVGFRNFRFLSPEYAQRSDILTTDELINFYRNDADTHPAHNNYLDTLCELGIFGFMAFIFWLIQCYRGCYYRDQPDGKIVMIILSYLLVSCFFGDIYNIKIFWVVTGIAGYFFYAYKKSILT